ncbi:sensor histidine kinase [Hydrogenophaga sp. OTU3427]|uniref:sensor histidine kinase n=1 Tax=Hydrogenophaga sp. OTU3427 TaxID=3043856 RepID=UPI00313D1827
MRKPRPPALAPWLIGALCAALGAWALARSELTQQREAFETDARIVHRLLSQRVVQHDAVLATLALLQPASDAERPEQRLPSVYPQILKAQRRSPGEIWPRADLQRAEAESRRLKRAALTGLDLPQARYELVIAAGSAAYALQIDLQQTVPWEEWPMKPAHSPVRVTLQHAGQTYVVQPGHPGTGGWRFGFEKALASGSQPFNVVAQRQVGWDELPWLAMAGWAALMAGAVWAWLAWQHQTTERRRAEELLRLGQVARLNTLGELAAGVAHELNQPLTAVLANTQAAGRLLHEDPPDLTLAQQAMDQAVQQARRATEVVGRMRRVVERPNAPGAVLPTSLEHAVRSALHLLEPELARRQVLATTEAGDAPQVLADPVALEQIVHNLLMNALHALEQVPQGERRVWLHLGTDGGQGVLRVRDSGPGIAPEVLPRLFQPFFSTRPEGLGLGLSLCETLAAGLGGSLSAANVAPRGAEFTLLLPLAKPPTP